MTWQQHADRLADAVTHRGSPWRDAVAGTPRHLLVPRWFDNATGDWALRDGRADEDAHLRAAYSDKTLATKVGGLHADDAKSDEHPVDFPTSCSPAPSLIVRMLDHAQIYDGADVLDIGTGSGYSAALLAHRLGNHRVKSIDVDGYLTRVAADRLGSFSLHPKLWPVDATEWIPGTYNRIVSTGLATPGIPQGWIKALRPGGRLVTVLQNTALILTANVLEPGEEWAAVGRIEPDMTMFMPVRHGPNYPARISDDLADAARCEPGHVQIGKYPLVKVTDAWELMSLLEVTAPGIVHDHTETTGGRRTALMMHPDGSWARAETTGPGLPVVHQDGPRRLWNILDRLREDFLRHGCLPLLGATAMVAHDGAIHLKRGNWQATIGT